MKIGILSDSHDHQKNTLTAIDLFNQHNVDYVLHAGDIVSPFTARTFHKLEHAKFIAVFGNNEGEKLMLQSVINGFGGEIHDYIYKGEIAGRSIHMCHVHHDVEEIVNSQMYDLIIYGHTHHQDIRRDSNTLVINPGETTDWITGTAHIVILDLDDMSPQSIQIN